MATSVETALTDLCFFKVADILFLAHRGLRPLYYPGALVALLVCSKRWGYALLYDRGRRPVEVPGALPLLYGPNGSAPLYDSPPGFMYMLTTYEVTETTPPHQAQHKYQHQRPTTNQHKHQHQHQQTPMTNKRTPSPLIGRVRWDPEGGSGGSGRSPCISPGLCPPWMTLGYAPLYETGAMPLLDAVRW